MTAASSGSSAPDLTPAVEVAARTTAEVAGRAASGELPALVVLVFVLTALVVVVLGVALLRRPPPAQKPPPDPPDGGCDGCSAAREVAEMRAEMRDLGRRVDAGLRAVHGRVDELLIAFARRPHAAE